MVVEIILTVISAALYLMLISIPILLVTDMYERKKIIIRDFWTCKTCGRRVDQDKIQIAHKIRQGSGAEEHIQDWLIQEGYGLRTRKWIRENIINHPLNVCVTCSSYCNDMQNIFFNPIEVDHKLTEILNALEETPSGTRQLRNRD